jgi:hypothetical protein
MGPVDATIVVGQQLRVWVLLLVVLVQCSCCAYLKEGVEDVVDGVGRS